MAQRIRSMTDGSPTKLLFAFALPLMAGNVFQQLYTVVDTAIVGQFVGVEALAAVGAADWLNWMVLGIVQGLTQGFSILMAQNFGAGDHRELSRSVGAALTLSVISAAVMLLLSQLAVLPILSLLGTPEDIVGTSILYLRIIFAGIPIITAYNFLASVLRALGDSKTPLYAMIMAALLNVGLDLLFVLCFHWGVAGAAIATVIAQAASSVYCFLVLRKVTVLHLERGDFRLNRQMALTLLKLGAPVALQNGIISIGGMVVQSVVNRFGMLFIAGYTATNKLYGILETAAVSYGYAVTSYVGQNLGAKLLGRIKKGMKAATVIALATSAVITACMILFGKIFLRLFISGSEAEVAAAMQVAYRFLVIMASCLSILYMLHIYRSALMGLGDTVVPMISGFVEMVIRIGSALLLSRVVGEDGVFIAEVGAWTGAAVLLVTAYFVRMRGLEMRKDLKDESVN